MIPETKQTGPLNNWNYLTYNWTLVIYYNAADQDYYIYQDGRWTEADDKWVQQVLDDKAYIDMPNQTFFTFLNPRNIFIGINISFDLR
jgi:hypothetical protein